MCEISLCRVLCFLIRLICYSTTWAMFAHPWHINGELLLAPCYSWHPNGELILSGWYPWHINGSWALATSLFSKLKHWLEVDICYLQLLTHQWRIIHGYLLSIGDFLLATLDTSTRSWYLLLATVDTSTGSCYLVNIKEELWLVTGYSWHISKE